MPLSRRDGWRRVVRVDCERPRILQYKLTRKRSTLGNPFRARQVHEDVVPAFERLRQRESVRCQRTAVELSVPDYGPPFDHTTAAGVGVVGHMAPPIARKDHPATRAPRQAYFTPTVQASAGTII
jgi:hypothetical protein